MNVHHVPSPEETAWEAQVWSRVLEGRPGLPEPPPAAVAPLTREEQLALLQRLWTQARLRAASYCLAPRLSGLSSLARQQARQIAAALFLLTGIRQAEAPLSGRAWPSLEESCRQLSRWEEAARAACQSARARCPAGPVRDLLGELAQGSAIQIQRLRLVLELL